MSVGSISGSFQFEFKIVEEIPPSHSKLKASGSGIKSTVDFETLIDLVDMPQDKTVMKWAAEANVGGLLAGVGQRLLRMAAERMVNQLFERLRNNLEK